MPVVVKKALLEVMSPAVAVAVLAVMQETAVMVAQQAEVQFILAEHMVQVAVLYQV
jgi:hypothetical protein